MREGIEILSALDMVDRVCSYGEKSKVSIMSIGRGVRD